MIDINVSFIKKSSHTTVIWNNISNYLPLPGHWAFVKPFGVHWMPPIVPVAVYDVVVFVNVVVIQ